MADKMKHVFICQLSDRWHLITCLSEMALVLKTLVKNLCPYLFIVANDQKCLKMIASSGAPVEILYKTSKWPVLFDKCIGKSVVTSMFYDAEWNYSDIGTIVTRGRC